MKTQNYYQISWHNVEQDCAGVETINQEIILARIWAHSPEEALQSSITHNPDLYGGINDVRVEEMRHDNFHTLEVTWEN